MDVLESQICGQINWVAFISYVHIEFKQSPMVFFCRSVNVFVVHKSTESVAEWSDPSGRRHVSWRRADGTVSWNVTFRTVLPALLLIYSPRCEETNSDPYRIETCISIFKRMPQMITSAMLTAVSNLVKIHWRGASGQMVKYNILWLRFFLGL